MSQIEKIEKDFSSGGLVWDAPKKKLLMVQVINLARKRVWTFPKGHPENGETDREAALREVREETGWNCTVIKPLSFVHYGYSHKSTYFAKTVRWFLMKPQKRVGSFDPKEIRDCRWVSLDEAPKKVSYDSDKDLLNQLFRLL